MSSENTNEIRLFSNMQIWYHKHIIHVIMFLIITGTPLVSPAFSWLAYLFGIPFSVFSGVSATDQIIHTGIQVCRIVHRGIGVVWIIISIPFIMSMLPKIFKWDATPQKNADESWSTYVKEGVEDSKRVYIDFVYPKRMGKYNIFQMLAVWGVIAICLLMLVSGVLLSVRTSINPEFASIVRTLHLAGYMAMLIFLIIHIYLAVHPINRAGYKAIFKTGTDTVDHAKKKHPGLFKNKS